MPRSSVTFVCGQCGGETLRWAGQCPYCQAWNTLQEFVVKKEPGRRKPESRSGRGATSGSSSAAPVPVTQISADSAPRLRLAWGEFDRVLGGGIVPGSHGTKEGAIAGRRSREHMFDRVLSLEGGRRQELRLLRAMKNRFGSAEEIGVFAMAEHGLEEVPDPSAAMLSQAGTASAGTAVVVVMEGTRPLLIEIQSLVNKANTNFPPPRVANGFDPNPVA